MPYVKLDCGILDSTIWFDRPAREVFITALLMAEPRELVDPEPQLEVSSLKPTGFVVPPGWYGFVAAAGPGLIHRAGVGLQEGLLALERLGSPEVESRTPAHEGRRLVRVNGGFIALNFDVYRTKDHTSAERQRRFRERRQQNKSNGVTTAGNGVTGRDVTQAEAEAEAYTEVPPLTPPAEGDKGAGKKTVLMRRAESLFRRRESTAWTSKELKAAKTNRNAITSTSEEDWQLLEWFYSIPPNGTYRRKDLATLLNNWNAELDRARAYRAEQGTNVRGNHAARAEL